MVSDRHVAAGLAADLDRPELLETVDVASPAGYGAWLIAGFGNTIVNAPGVVIDAKRSCRSAMSGGGQFAPAVTD